MKTRILLLLLGLSASIGIYIMLTATDTHAARPQPGTVVTLDVYSGKPNPSWTLPKAAGDELARRVDALSVTAPDAPEFDGLGYRSVSAVTTADDGKQTAVTASRGVVTLEKAGQRRRLVDSGRAFELWLVNTGAGELKPELLKQVVASIKPAPR